MTDSTVILPQSYGYGFIVGLGAAFALLMAIITRILTVYLGQKQNSERFSTASRNVRSGLIASSTVSAWTWPATLLSSGTWCYSHGVMGGFCYGVGGTVQITLFLFLAIQLKRHAPTAHTISECFYIRFGKAGHIVFLFYVIGTNILVSSLLLLGGSQAFSVSTGMSVIGASFLLPIGVMVYTALGGLKATFISDWIHTLIIYVILLITCYTVFGTSKLIGSPGKMYDMLQEVEKVYPSDSGRSYLSFHDQSMMFLTWAVCLGGLSEVFGDPGYSQRAIAADASSVFQGYLMGGLCWLVIPAALGSSTGLAARALLLNPASVTYPNPLNDAEVTAAMPVLYGMKSLLGTGGAAAGLLMVFMSVTSATSAELIAFASVTTYDIYRTYMNPHATGKQLVRCSHLAVVGFSLFMACLSVGFNYAGVSCGWLLTVIGIFMSPVVSSVTLCLFWPKMTKMSLLIGAPLGTLTGVACWLGCTYAFSEDHKLNLINLGGTEACFVADIAAVFSSPIYIGIISFLKPDAVPFDLKNLSRDVVMGDDCDKEEKEAIVRNDKERKLLDRQSIWSIVINILIVLVVYVMVVTILYAVGKDRDWTKAGFTAYIVILMIWLLCAALYIVLTPLWQGRRSLKFVLSHMLRFKVPDVPFNELPTTEQGISSSGSTDDAESVTYIKEKASEKK